MKYLLYCDMKTLKCTENTINKILKDNSDSYMQISKDLWAFDTYEHSFCWEFQSVTEYFINVLLDEYLSENSICIISDVKTNHLYYNLPLDAADYLNNDMHQ